MSMSMSMSMFRCSSVADASCQGTDGAFFYIHVRALYCGSTVSQAGYVYGGSCAQRERVQLYCTFEVVYVVLLTVHVDSS